MVVEKQHVLRHVPLDAYGQSTSIRNSRSRLNGFLRNAKCFVGKRITLTVTRFSDFVLLPLRPAFVTHKNPQRRKIIHGMRPVGRKDQSIDLNICIRRNIRPVRVISVAFIMCVV